MRELAETVTQLSLAATYSAGGTTYDVTVVPPDAASRAALDERALELAQMAATYAGENLRSGLKMSADTTIAACKSGDLDDDPGGDGLTYGESLANDLVEAAHLADESAVAAVEANIAVADASFSELANRGEAARAAWTAPVLSRLHAAELLAGRAEAPPPPLGAPPAEMASAAYVDWAFLHDGFAPTTPIAAGGRSALDILRQAGLSPNDVYDTTAYDFGDLYSGSGGVTVGLRDALAELTGQPELGGGSPIDAEEFLELYGISESDVLAARTYMREEAVAFGRDPLPVLPNYPLASDAMGEPVYYSGERYVATTVPAGSPPESYYVRLARLHADGNDDRDAYYSSAVRPSTEYASEGLAGTLDYALTIAYAVTAHPSSPEIGAGIDALGGLIEGEWERRLARVETCYGYNVGDQHNLRISVYVTRPKASIAAGDYLLVRGTAGVTCATRGNIDGAPCLLADYLPTEPGLNLDHGSVRDVTDAALGFPTLVEFFFKGVDSGQVVDLHLVHRAGGMPANSAGAYEAYGPVHFDAFDLAPSSSNTPILCNAYGVFFGMDKEIYAALAPSVDDPGSPLASCGALTDTRLPLENELIDDGDGIESSWRHHLAVARAAADYADALGEEVIESGLGIDSRADMANEALLSACGASVNLDGLFGASAGTAVSPGPCPTGSDGEPEGLNVGASCVRLALENIEAEGEFDRDARVLAQCLSQDSVLPAVALGGRELCVWHPVGDAGLICSGASAGNPCPFPAVFDESSMTYSCAGRAPAGAVPGTYATLLVDHVLGLFGDEYGDPTIVSSGAPSCTDVHNLRRLSLTPSARAQALERILASGFYGVGNVQAWARRIGWEARIGNHSAFTIDGVPWLQTGDTFGAATSPYWPCSSALLGSRSRLGVGPPRLSPCSLATTTVCCPPSASR